MAEELMSAADGNMSEATALMTNKNPAQILDAYLLKFRGSKKAKLTQQPAGSRYFCESLFWASQPDDVCFQEPKHGS
jgi:hypothetical protein